MNMDENIAILPDPLLRTDGTRISDPAQWPAQREALCRTVERCLYGTLPPAPPRISGTVLESAPAYDGRALRERVRVDCGQGVTFTLDVLHPAVGAPVPVVLLNRMSPKSMDSAMLEAMHVNAALLYSAPACPIEDELIARGFALAVIDDADICGDYAGAPCALRDANPGFGFGTIAAWAWGMMRAADWLCGSGFADPQRLIVTGHSRYGKAALCAGALCERFAVVAPMGSGCGGAGCSRVFGGGAGEGSGAQETLGSMTAMFPHWLSDNILEFCAPHSGETGFAALLEAFSASVAAGKRAPGDFNAFMVSAYPPCRENELPFDQNTVRALVAPRALITCDGLADDWANPYGAYVSWLASREVWKLFGAEEKTAAVFREGGHSYAAEDWRTLLDFAGTIFAGGVPSVPAPPFTGGEKHVAC